MNFLDTKLTKRMSIFNAALFVNIGYLIVVLILKGIQGLVTSDGVYSTVFGITEFVVAAIYWIGFNWILFRKADVSDYSRKAIYIIMNLLPAIIFTLLTIFIMYVTPGYDFSTAWNQFTFVIAPTLFWYLPYGYLFYATGMMLPIAAMMIICLLFAGVMQFIGVMIGSSTYAHEQERLRQAKLEQQKRLAEQRAKRAQQEKEAAASGTVSKPRVSPVRRRSAVLDATAGNVYPSTSKKGDRPFRDEEDTSPIIYTEAISVISDEMIEAENQKKLDKAFQQKATGQDDEPIRKEDGSPNWEIPGKTRRRK